MAKASPERASPIPGRSPRAAGRDPACLAIRREIIEFSQLPISSWLPTIDSVSAILFLVQTLSEAGHTQRDGRCEALRAGITGASHTALGLKLGLCAGFIGTADLAKCLEVPVLHAQVGAERRSVLSACCGAPDRPREQVLCDVLDSVADDSGLPVVGRSQGALS